MIIYRRPPCFLIRKISGINNDKANQFKESTRWHSIGLHSCSLAGRKNAHPTKRTGHHAASGLIRDFDLENKKALPCVNAMPVDANMKCGKLNNPDFLRICRTERLNAAMSLPYFKL